MCYCRRMGGERQHYSYLRQVEVLPERNGCLEGFIGASARRTEAFVRTRRGTAAHETESEDRRRSANLLFECNFECGKAAAGDRPNHGASTGTSTPSGEASEVMRASFLCGVPYCT